MPRYYNPYYPQARSSASSILWGAIVLIIIMIVIYLWIKKKADEDFKNDMPNEYEDEKYSTEEGKMIRSIASALADDLEGLNMSHDEALYVRFRGLSDKLFEAVCNDYRRIAGESIRTALTSDWFSFAGIGENVKSYKAILQRIDSLNII